MIHLVLLSGGSGTRLWPLSNNSRSKQFLKVLRDEDGNHVSMVQRVFDQVRVSQIETNITIATSASQQVGIESQLSGRYSLVLEPERRDTAPAIMLASINLAMSQGANIDDTVVVMPIDTYADQMYYNSIKKLDKAVQMNEADLILLGVEPTYPSEKYGYIVPAIRQGEIWSVDSFLEKPSKDVARDLITQGGLWNCGVFASRLKYLIDLVGRYYQPKSYEDLRAHYSRLPKTSFDYEVVEKAKSVAVVPYSGKWKDLGTWNTLTEEMAEDCSGRVVLDSTTCSNVHVINETGLPMVVAGIQDAVVIAAPDGILVSGKEASAHIKTQVAEAAEKRPMYERRRWGEYRVVDITVFSDGSKALTKELVVDPGCQLSYQKHSKRSEVWTTISGYGEVVIEGELQKISRGSVIKISPLELHAVRAISELHIIEVQLGDYLEEEDIERCGNYWNEWELRN